MSQTKIVFSSKEMQKKIEKMIKATKDSVGGKKYVLRKLSPVVFSDIIKHFEKETGPKGSWASWSAMYARHMAKIGKSGNKKLQDTGRLKTGFNVKNSSSNRQGYVFYNPVVYAKRHDEGGGGIPARPFMWISKDGVTTMEKVLLGIINE